MIWKHTMAAAGLAALVMVSLAVPETARACGGFFCNGGAPIDQAGERIVFSVEDDGTTTTHVQIQYQGTAEEFAWIVPVPSLPEVSVGTDALFQAIDPQTAPQFLTQQRVTGTCRERPRCPGPRTSGGDAGSFGWSDASGLDAGAAPDGSSPDPGVEVHFRDAVGPYDAVVLSSSDPEALRTWLADNGYDIPDASLPLIDHYVEKRDYFVALKLLNDRTSGEIQPIVLRYEERQPCIPIRLTAIAAVSDMPIIAWVFAGARALPYNYVSLQAPDSDPGLYMGGTTYEDAVSVVVDAAGGRAFVTDYSGSPPAVRLAMPEIADLRDLTDPGEVVRQLLRRGYAAEPQTLGILARHVPPPDGVSAGDFYNCLADDWCAAYDEHLASLAFDANALVDEVEELIRTPRAEAEALVGRHSTVTRLFTTISPAEMTEDPVFVLSETSPPVARTHTATLLTECSSEYFFESAPQKLVMPNGTERVLRSGTSYGGTDDDYCLSRTGYDTDGCPEEGCADEAAMRERGGCAAAGGGTGGALALLCGLALALWQRRRR